MKKLAVFLAVLMVAVVMAGGSALAGIVGSKHDLSASSTNGGIKSTDEPQICIFCHTPHAQIANKPLWNHEVTTATYTMYSSTTLEGTVDPAPADGSELCLSCHDGTVAINQILNKSTVGSPTLTDSGTGRLTNNKLNATSTALLGTDLSKSHPVSITYRNDLDSGLKPTDAGGKSVGGLPLFGNTAPYKVQCGSCHSVHDNTNPPFLRVNNTGSALCLKCHNK